MARTVNVALTELEIGVLRRLIVDEAKRLGYPYQRDSEAPSKYKRMRGVALKVYNAQNEIKGRPMVGRDGYPVTG